VIEDKPVPPLRQLPADGAVEAGQPAPFTGAGLDQPFHALLAQLTLGLSPIAMTQALTDWAQHLALSPDKQAELWSKALRKYQRLLAYAVTCTDSNAPPCIEPLPQDKRFTDPAWQQWPFNLWYQSFLLTQQWWHNATTGVRGVSKHHEDLTAFMARQMLDMFSPSNFALTNPKVIDKTIKEQGMNFVRGARNALEDLKHLALKERPVGADAFVVGKNVAVTPGKVIFRNRLIELIQYGPATREVYAEPILIVPAWIMKYYILDLSPNNSLVRYLVENGHTVFMISWKNPTAAEADVSMDDYRRLGVMSALDAVSTVVPDQKIHALGYCLGGTLLSIAAAAMARDGDTRLGSLTLLAAQTDFTEPGELSLFIDDDQIDYLQDMMAARGYLDAMQMAGAFQMLRSNDLVWSASVHEYLMGERTPMNDLMAWNADATRMPYRMHSEYLRTLFLDNELATGRFVAGGKRISLRDIRVPIFAVSTITDHVAPWHSVYKIHDLTEAEITFLLSNGGHNAGIVSEPGHRNRHFHVATHPVAAPHVDPDAWLEQNQAQDGSWWPVWAEWLGRRSGGMVAPPPMGMAVKGFAPLADAPGAYVLEV